MCCSCNRDRGDADDADDNLGDDDGVGCGAYDGDDGDDMMTRFCFTDEMAMDLLFHPGKRYVPRSYAFNARVDTREGDVRT